VNARAARLGACRRRPPNGQWRTKTHTNPQLLLTMVFLLPSASYSCAARLPAIRHVYAAPDHPWVIHDAVFRVRVVRPARFRPANALPLGRPCVPPSGHAPARRYAPKTSALGNLTWEAQGISKRGRVRLPHIPQILATKTARAKPSVRSGLQPSTHRGRMSLVVDES